MKTAHVVMIAAVLTFSVAAAEPDADGKPALVCEGGPTTKELGKSQWLMYGCADRKSAIIVSSDANSNPFYVMIYPKGTQYRIRGEGNGNGAAATAAVSELHAMSSRQLHSLVEEANKAH